VFENKFSPVADPEGSTAITPKLVTGHEPTGAIPGSHPGRAAVRREQLENSRERPDLRKMKAGRRRNRKKIRRDQYDVATIFTGAIADLISTHTDIVCSVVAFKSCRLCKCRSQ
jgi:hypothetical protein